MSKFSEILYYPLGISLGLSVSGLRSVPFLSPLNFTDTPLAELIGPYFNIKNAHPILLSHKKRMK